MENKYLEEIKKIEEYARKNYVPIIKKEAAEYIKNILSAFILKKIEEEKIEKKVKKNKKENEESKLEKEEIKIKLNFLELGTAIGYSATIFTKHIIEEARRLEEKLNTKIKLDLKYISCEKDEDRFKLAKENLNLFNEKDLLETNKYIQIYNEDAEIFVENLNKVIEDEKIDIAFIDANKSAYLKYFLEILEYLNKENIILFDNILYNGWVFGEYKEKKHRSIVNNLRKFIKFLEYSKIKYIIEEKADGILKIENLNYANITKRKSFSKK